MGRFAYAVRGAIAVIAALMARMPAHAAECAPGTRTGNPFTTALHCFEATRGAADNVPLEEVIGSFIQAAIALVGVLFFAYMVYGGFLWMTARGESDQVDKAKEVLKHATIGLAITLGAYAVTYYVVLKFTTAAGLG